MYIHGFYGHRRHNLVNMRFVYTKIPRPKWDIMLYEGGAIRIVPNVQAYCYSDGVTVTYSQLADVVL